MSSERFGCRAALAWSIVFLGRHSRVASMQCPSGGIRSVPGSSPGSTPYKRFTKAPLNQKAAFRVNHIRFLEQIIHDVSSIKKCMVGQVLFCVHSCSRWRDSQRLQFSHRIWACWDSILWSSVDFEDNSLSRGSHSFPSLCWDRNRTMPDRLGDGLDGCQAWTGFGVWNLFAS